MEKDIVDTASFGLDGLTDDELFLLAMQAKMKDAASRLNLGMRNIIMLNAGGEEEEMSQQAAETLKRRRNIL